jgi:hypothetical protein
MTQVFLLKTTGGIRQWLRRLKGEILDEEIKV